MTNENFAVAVDVTSIADKSAFLKISFGVLGNTRKVRTDVLKQEIKEQTADNRLKTTMKLLESQELNDIKTADAEFKRELRKYCLPAMPQVLAVPKGAIPKMAKLCKEYAIERQKLITLFLDRYYSLVAKAEQELGPCFVPSNYLTLTQVAESFVFEYQFITFGVPGMLQELDPELYAEQSEKAEKVLVEAANEMAGFMRQSVFELVSHLADRLSPNSDGKAKRLHQSAIDNVLEFLNTFQLRNVTDDKALASQMENLKAVMSGCSADSLKESEVFKSATLDKLQSIKGSLATLVEESGRVFRNEE